MTSDLEKQFSFLHSVINWRKEFDLPIRQVGEEVPDEELELAIKLIREEYKEYLAAKEVDDKVEILDALGDMIVVATQYIHVTGFNINSYERIVTDKIDHLMDWHPINGHLSINLIELCALEINSMNVSVIELLQEISNSNMSKACFSIQEAKDTCAKYDLEGIDVYVTTGNGSTLIVKRSDDSKVLKSINFKQPNLIKFLNK